MMLARGLESAEPSGSVAERLIGSQPGPSRPGGAGLSVERVVCAGKHSPRFVILRWASPQYPLFCIPWSITPQEI